MTIKDTTQQEHDRIIADMSPYLESDSDCPQIGIFWFDKDENDFFGVNSMDYNEVKDINGHRTYPKLHKTIWQKERFKAISLNKKTKFEGDYTQIPRGRVNYEDGEFVVYVGKWIDEYEKIVTELIKIYFNLKEFRYQKDIHWDLGHGWSGDR